jgi:hypothetical protein
MEQQITRAGIVEGVSARRKNKEVVSLAVNVRFDTMLVDSYAYGEGTTQTDEVSFSLPPNSGVNPGDVVVMDLTFKSPFGQRFVPALSVGDNEEE